MSKIIEQLADKGDAVITRWSEKHLPQSEIAIERRKRAAKVVGTIAAGTLVVGGIAAFTEVFIGAADHQAQHIQEQNEEWTQHAVDIEQQLEHNRITLDVPTSNESK